MTKAIRFFLIVAFIPISQLSFSQLPIQLLGHVGSINGTAFSLDGTIAATVSSDNTVKIYQTSSGILLRTFGLFDDVNAVAFLPSGRQILTGSADNTAALWDISSGRRIRTFTHQSDVTSVAVSFDGLLMVTGSLDNTAAVWRVATGERVVEFQHSDDVRSVAFSPNGLQIITGVADGSAFLWDITTVLNPEATLTPTQTQTPTHTPTASPTLSPTPTNTRLPTPTLTSTPVIPPTPTVTNTPINTPTPAVPVLSPVFSLTFDSLNEFGRVPGGFTGLPAGNTTIGLIPGSAGGLADGFGAIITTRPGEVELLTLPTIEVTSGLVAVRLAVRTTATNASLSLAAIDGSSDGTITLNTRVDSGQYLNQYKRMVALIEPKTNRVAPIFQVANIPGTQEVITYIDKLEIFVLPKDSITKNSFLLGE